MSNPFTILFKSLVKPFYQDNSGFFLFFFIFMFFIVGHLNGAGLFEYHYFLVLEMMRNGFFYLFVLFVWVLYCRKTLSFVSKKMQGEDYRFLYIFNSLQISRRFGLFVLVNFFLLLPVVLYSLFAFFSGWRAGFYGTSTGCLIYVLCLVLLSAFINIRILDGMTGSRTFFWNRMTIKSILPVSYPVILLRFVAKHQKMIWLGIKVFTCGTLYGILRNNVPGDYDTKLAFVFYIFGVLANGFVVFAIRVFEEYYLSFYRGLPISMPRRFFAYCLTYFILLIPEFVTLTLLVPRYVRTGDAVTFMLSGYFTLMLLNSLAFTVMLRIRHLLMAILLTGTVQYIFLLAGITVYLYLAFFALSAGLFFFNYLRFEDL